MCTNPGCGAILNKRDLATHESELWEYRKLKCHSCGEITKTLADMEKRMARIETNQANVETKLVNSEKNMNTRLDYLKNNNQIRTRNTDTTMKNNTAIMDTRMTNIDTRMANMETKMAQMKTDMDAKFETVNNEVKELKTALVEAFDQMKDVLIKMEDNIKENARKVRNAPSGDRENIIVAGGSGNDSVEIFNWRQRTWSPLQSMPKKRWGATSFVYNNQVVVAGGCCAGSGTVDDMIGMNVDEHPDLSKHWRIQNYLLR